MDANEIGDAIAVQLGRFARYWSLGSRMEVFAKRVPNVYQTRAKRVVAPRILHVLSRRAHDMLKRNISTAQPVEFHRAPCGTP
jgi:hypothetical protein